MSKSVKSTKKEVQKRFIFSDKHFILLLAGIITIIYSRTFFFDLVYCDDHEIIINLFSRIEHFGNFFSELFKGYMTTDYYRPLINISFLIDAQLGGQNPSIYHISNVFFHFIFCLLLYYFLNKLKFDKTISALGALLFAVHPLMLNSVAWIVGRNDMLCGIFMLLSFIFLLKQYDNPEKVNFRNIFFHSVFFLMALLSKETAIVLPLLLVSYILLIKNEKLLNKQNYFLAASWLLSISVFGFLRSISLLGKPAYNNGFYLLENIRIFPEFIAKFFMPLKIEVLATYSNLNTYTGIGLIIILAILFFKYRKESTSNFVFSLIWFVIFLAPGLFVQNTDVHDWNEYLECRAYFASIGLILPILSILDSYKVKITERNNLLWSGLILLLFSGLTFAYSSNYKNSEAFYEKAVSDNPSKARFHLVLSQIYYKQSRWDMTEKELIAATIANPKYSYYTYALASFYYDRQRLDESLRYGKKALALDSSSVTVYNFLVYTLLGMNQYNEAKLYCLKGLEKVKDEKLKLSFFLMKIYLKTDSLTEAEKIALSLKSSGNYINHVSDAFNGKAMSFIKEEKSELALDMLNFAVSVDSSNVKALNNLFVFYFQKIPDYKKAYHVALLLARKGIYIKKKDMDFLTEKNKTKKSE